MSESKIPQTENRLSLDAVRVLHVVENMLFKVEILHVLPSVIKHLNYYENYLHSTKGLSLDLIPLLDQMPDDEKTKAKSNSQGREGVSLRHGINVPFC